MNELVDYQVRFLDAEGFLLDDIPLLAESLAVASDCARVIGAEIGAADFFITSKPSLIRSWPNAA